MEAFERKNLKFNLRKEEQRLANDFLEKLGRGQSQFVSLLIKNFLQNCGIVNSEALSKEEVKRMVASFQKIMGPEEIDYVQRMINGGQFSEMKKEDRQSVTDHQKPKENQYQNETQLQHVQWSATDHETSDGAKNKILKVAEDEWSVTDRELKDNETEDELLQSSNLTDDEDEPANDGFDFAADLLDQLSMFGG